MKRTAAVKGFAGILTGLDGVSDTVMAFGGDGIFAMTDEITIMAGVSLWSYTVAATETASATASMTTLSAGLGYNLWLGKGMRIEVAGKGALGMFTSEATVELAEVEETTSVTETAGGAVIQTAFHLQLGAFSVGPEIRVPIWFGEYSKEVAYQEVLLFGEFSF